MSKTACIIPWTNFVVRPDGTAHFCCDVLPNLKVNGRPGNLARDSFDDLWNADELVRVRAAMARGEKPESCHVCWKQEAGGGVSRRLLINPVYRALGGGLAVETLSQESAATEFRLERRPDWFVFELGNVCTLACRSCNPLSSSRVAADRIQAAWIGNGASLPSDGIAWFKQVDKLVDMIAGTSSDNIMLSLMGGEPFLIETTWQLLEALVERGVAPRVYVGLSSNGQQQNARLGRLATHFRGFNVSVSVDGFGKLNDYLRHGSDWAKIVSTVAWLRSIPKVDVAIVPTLQNCNVLDMTTLVRFADDHDLPLGYNALTEPARLRASNLPPSVRRIAARRLRAYLDRECKPINRGVVRAYCDVIEESSDAFDLALFREFAIYTNDLDADRRESLSAAAPELVALIRAAGVEWPHDRRHARATAVSAGLDPALVPLRVNRTVSSSDVIFATGDSVRSNWYFESSASQLAEIDARLREHDVPGFSGSRAVADYGSHYGRMSRTLRAMLPHAALYACDIDVAAVRFCAREFAAEPIVTGWKPDRATLPSGLDAIVCISLLTHTPLEHWRETLRAWARMLRPGGVVAFTYLSEHYIAPWLAGELPHYGSYPPDAELAVSQSIGDVGFGFAALTDMYGEEPWYGIAFATSEVVLREIASAGLETIELSGDSSGQFSQHLALVRKPIETVAPISERRETKRDVTVVALYDPRCYAPATLGEGDPGRSAWARLTTRLSAPLPTELGFGDPRVAEVREAQAALACEHGIDAFCYLYAWGSEGARWDAPFREMLASGRPDLPFCVSIAVDRGATIEPATAEQLVGGLATALCDRRYLRVEGRPLIVVRDIERVTNPRSVAATWRRVARDRGIGEIHLCAVRPELPPSAQELGFDSFLEAPGSAADLTTSTADAATAPWPEERWFRRVTCYRDSSDPHASELYEFALRAAIEATRRRGEALVFVDAWNDWSRGRYLEPDDRDGRRALLATRRAARGPASGLVLLRRLRDVLGAVEPSAIAVLEELEGVVSLHERARDGLSSAVEAALGRTVTAPIRPLRTIPIWSRQLDSASHFAHLDIVDETYCSDIVGGEPVVIRGDEVRLRGWAHVEDHLPTTVDVYLALEASAAYDDRVFCATARTLRPDVPAIFAGFPETCGYDVVANVTGLAPGTYRVAIVQRTPDATYRDVTAVKLVREEATCSKT